MAGGSSDAVTDTLGIIAGVLLAICLMPQLWKMWKTKSATDIAYGWTAFYFVGLVFYFVYLFRLNAIVGYIGILVEAVLVVLVVAGKFYLEHFYQRRHAAQGLSPDAGIDGVVVCGGGDDDGNGVSIGSAAATAAAPLSSADAGAVYGAAKDGTQAAGSGAGPGAGGWADGRREYEMSTGEHFALGGGGGGDNCAATGCHRLVRSAAQRRCHQHQQQEGHVPLERASSL